MDICDSKFRLPIGFYYYCKVFLCNKHLDLETCTDMRRKIRPPMQFTTFVLVLKVLLPVELRVNDYFATFYDFQNDHPRRYIPGCERRTTVSPLSMEDDRDWDIFARFMRLEKSRNEQLVREIKRHCDSPTG
ncbi:hypothetical protein CEXT_508121 [Caerostris extrusa]|uniref:Uncharacterized protein n=1 Tax=Caerostris extrusa TaxID=172846 RepID=A0AAV4XX88_CAEEX|nr:hypothetical protein CEXT_508121 [Caerostris extrusa]